jgi:hypothetical protein
MNDNRTTKTQDLKEAFTSIISMILGLLRAQGLRGLIHLPALWLLSRQLRRMAEEFCQLFDAWKAGTLPPVPAPAPWPTPQPRSAAPAQSPAPPPASARPAAPRIRRPRSQPARAQLAHAGARARPRAAVWPPSTPIPLPSPRGLVRTSVSQKRTDLAALPWHALNVAI